jgi:hypothetical protein
MYKFSPSAIVQEKRSGGFYRIEERQRKPIRLQGNSRVVDINSYIVVPLFGPKTRWSVNEDDLEIPVNFPAYRTPPKHRAKPRIAAPRKLSRWEALLKVCEEAI